MAKTNEIDQDLAGLVTADFEGAQVDRMLVGITNAGGLEVKGPLRRGDYVTVLIRGRVTGVGFPERADNMVDRLHKVSAKSAELVNRSRKVDPNQAGLFEGKPQSEDGEKGTAKRGKAKAEDPKAAHLRALEGGPDEEGQEGDEE